MKIVRKPWEEGEGKCVKKDYPASFSYVTSPKQDLVFRTF